MPFTKIVFLIGSLALVGIPPFAGFFSKDPIIAAALAHGGWYGDLIYVACVIGAFLTGLYAFRLYFIVFTGEPTAFAREHFHKHHGQEGPLSMRWTVGVLAVLSTRRPGSSSSRRSGRRSRPGSTPLPPRSSSRRTRRSTSPWPSSVAVRPRRHRRRVDDLRRASASRRRSRSRCSSGSSTGTSSTTSLWYRGSDLLARGLYAFVERPLIAGSLSAVTGAVGLGSRELSLAQTGLVRSYALALAGGLAILAVVFLAAR